MDGILNIRKAAGPTSHDVVDSVRRIFGQKRVGHSGTLDPMATGVLIVCLGKATRIVEYLTGADKEYHATMVLGVRTDTQDSTGNVISEADASGVTLDALWHAAAKFVGDIEQIPPMISAIKHQGKPLYKLARQGVTVERKPRRVCVRAIEIRSFREDDHPEIGIVVKCSSGTYIRTLCADIGDALGCGAMMSSLERTRVGRFGLEDAVTIEQLAEAQSQGKLQQYVMPISDVLADMPAIDVDSEGEWRILHGLSVPSPDSAESGATVKIMSDGELIAIGAIEAGTVKPRKVLKDTDQ